MRLARRRRMRKPPGDKRKKRTAFFARKWSLRLNARLSLRLRPRLMRRTVSFVRVRCANLKRESKGSASSVKKWKLKRLP